MSTKKTANNQGKNCRTSVGVRAESIGDTHVRPKTAAAGWAIRPLSAQLLAENARQTGAQVWA